MEISTFNILEHPHKRYNALTGEWVLVSPHRTKRPWQGKMEAANTERRPPYDPGCYLCPGNKRSDGSENPDYSQPYSFTNDFSSLLSDTPEGNMNEGELLRGESVKGICKVICFSPRHDLTLPQMETEEIVKVIDLWQQEYASLSAREWIKYIQIFENKGEIMGCSNPHPHGQIWSQSDLPVEIVKELAQQTQYFEKHGRTLLSDYLAIELKSGDRIVCDNEHFTALVPYWAVWPYETMIISKRPFESITQITEAEKISLADILRRLTIRYDNLFETSFPYSAGMHQAPVNSGNFPQWHWHMHFYPPLLRSATVKKFMVGYEMLANPQRDVTAEWAAERLRIQSETHYLS